MAKFTKDEFIKGISEMTILELKELVDAMKDELGIDATAVAVAAPAAVIKILKEITGLGLVEAKALADNGGNVKENVAADEAEAIKTQLTEAGAEVELA